MSTVPESDSAPGESSAQSSSPPVSRPTDDAAPREVAEIPGTETAGTAAGPLLSEHSPAALERTDGQDPPVSAEGDPAASAEGKVVQDPPASNEATVEAVPSVADVVLRFSGTYLLTTGPDGPAAVPGLQITFDGAGITVAKDNGTAVWSTTWVETAELATPERSKLPDGRSGVVVVVTTRLERTHRFVVPAEKPAALEAALGSLAHRHGVAPLPTVKTQSLPIVIGAVVVAAAAVAVLLLAAGHVIHL